MALDQSFCQKNECQWSERRKCGADVPKYIFSKPAIYTFSVILGTLRDCIESY